MATETIDKPTATAEAGSYAEHKRIRLETHEKVETKSDTKTPEPKAEPTETGAEDNGRTAEPDTAEKPEAKTDTEADAKPDRPKRDRTAEGKINELTARAKKAEEERERYRAELEEARKPKAAPEPAKTETTEAPKAATDDTKPKLADFVKKLAATETYEDAVERHAEALLDWKDKQRAKADAAAAEERQKAEAFKAQEPKIEAARAKHDDFDTAIGNLRKDGATPLTPAMLQFVIEHPDGFEVAYALGSNLAERERIAKLSPAMQMAELAYIAKDLTPSAQQAKVPVSKAPAPAAPLRAAVGESTDKKTTADAGSYAEHKRLRMGK